MVEMLGVGDPERRPGEDLSGLKLVPIVSVGSVMFESNELLNPGCSDWLTSSCRGGIVVVAWILTSISGFISGTAGTWYSVEGVDGVDVGDTAGTSMGGPAGTSTGGPTGTCDSPTGTGPNGPGT